MLSIMLSCWTGLYVYLSCAVCVSDNDIAIVDLMQPTELRCEHFQCPVLEKLNPQILVQKGRLR